MEEIWKPVVGWEYYYEVSNLGNVKVLNRTVKSKSRSGNIFEYTKFGHSILPNINKYGYQKCVLSLDNLNKTKLIHQLVAQAFIPNPDNKPQVNHINGVKTDNRVENLEWVTSKENIQHSIDNGLKGICLGEKNSSSVLTKEKIEEIKSRLSKGEKGKDIAIIFGVHKATISDIKTGKTWKHI